LRQRAIRIVSSPGDRRPVVAAHLDEVLAPGKILHNPHVETDAQSSSCARRPVRLSGSNSLMTKPDRKPASGPLRAETAIFGSPMLLDEPALKRQERQLPMADIHVYARSVSLPRFRSLATHRKLLPALVRPCPSNRHQTD
jgi:hypothetical protein